MATLRAPATTLTAAAVCPPDPTSEVKEQTKALEQRECDRSADSAAGMAGSGASRSASQAAILARKR